MSIKIYSYTNPYELDREVFWDDIKDAPHFCVSQTMANGLSTIYPGLKNAGLLTTVRNLINALYKDWENTDCMVRQIIEVDNAINNFPEGVLSSTEKNSLLFNTKSISQCIRLFSELGIKAQDLRRQNVNIDQQYLIDIYQSVSELDNSNFVFKRISSESVIDNAIKETLSTHNNEINHSSLSIDRVVIHGIHQFSPAMLCLIEDLSKFKEVVLIFNYQKQYAEVYDTWLNIYSLFNTNIGASSNSQFTPISLLVDSYKSNLLADCIGSIANGEGTDTFSSLQDIEVIEFENLTEFVNYSAMLFEKAKLASEKAKEKKPVLAFMPEQLYSASGKANDVLRAYFPEQFGERHFLDYPIGHFFVSIANMWDEESKSVVVSNFSDIKECLNSGIISESKKGILISTFNAVLPYIEKQVTLQGIIKRLQNLQKYVGSSQPERSRAGYFNVAKDSLQELIRGLNELNQIIHSFFDDFGHSSSAFSEFYSRIKKFLISHVKENDSLDDAMKDIINRLLNRLMQTDLPDSGTFNCLKQTMSFYLSQDENLVKGAQWIVRGFEQIDGDILRSVKQDASTTLYHFCCLSDKDICASKDESLPWPLDISFFEYAHAPLDWKYQVYLKSKMEYHNFYRYALLYGLEFNRVGFKLSYIKNDDNKTNDVYHILKLLNIPVVKYKSIAGNAYSPRLKYETGNEITIDEIVNGLKKTDYYKYAMCPYRFSVESLIQERTVFRDRFLIHTYMRVIIGNKVKKALQNTLYDEQLLSETILEKYQSVEDLFQISDELERTQLIASVHSDIKRFFIGRNNRYKKYNPIDDGLNEDLLLINLKKIEDVPTKETLKEIIEGTSSYKYEIGSYCMYCASKDICLERKYTFKEQ